jgi:hypothetical protein
VRYTNYPYREARVVACPECTAKKKTKKVDTCKIILHGTEYICDCWRAYEEYRCRCESCKWENIIDVKWNLIKNHNWI